MNSNTYTEAKPPFFSVVIPSYNRADFLPKTIQSVLDQQYTHFEVIIVDDGSTDHTGKVTEGIIQHDDRISYFYKENGERGAARNFGSQKAKGDYVYFLDSDDLLYPDHLMKAAQFIEENEHPPIFFLPYEVVEASGTLVQSLVPIKGSLNQLLVTQGNLLSCHGVFLRADTAKAFPFNEDRNLSGSEDYELWLRISSHYEIPYANVVTSALVHHDERSVLNFNAEKLIQRKKLMIQYVFSNENFMEKYGKFKQRIIGNTYLYIALHLALTKKYRMQAIRWLLKSFFAYPPSLFVRSFWGTLKHLI
ncbi:MAG: glycosyltransferase [Bacteroidota bacterium]